MLEQEVDKPTLNALALQEWPNFPLGNDMIFAPQQKFQNYSKTEQKATIFNKIDRNSKHISGAKFQNVRYC